MKIIQYRRTSPDRQRRNHVRVDPGRRSHVKEGRETKSHVNHILETRNDTSAIAQALRRGDIVAILPNEGLDHELSTGTPLIVTITGVVLATGRPAALQRDIAVPLAIIEARLRGIAVSPRKNIPLVLLLRQNLQRMLSKNGEFYLALLHPGVD